jgi:hypothetical protein
MWMPSFGVTSTGIREGHSCMLRLFLVVLSGWIELKRISCCLLLLMNTRYLFYWLQLVAVLWCMCFCFKLKLHLFNLLWICCGFVVQQVVGFVESCGFVAQLVWPTAQTTSVQFVVDLLWICCVSCTANPQQLNKWSLSFSMQGCICAHHETSYCAYKILFRLAISWGWWHPTHTDWHYQIFVCEKMSDRLIRSLLCKSQQNSNSMHRLDSNRYMLETCGLNDCDVEFTISELQHFNQIIRSFQNLMKIDAWAIAGKL